MSNQIGNGIPPGMFKPVSSQSKGLTEQHSLRDYLLIIRSNYIAVITIFLICVGITISYVLTATDFYTTITSVKVNKPQDVLMSTNLISALEGRDVERQLSNEIEIMMTTSIRRYAASNILDSISKMPDKDVLYYSFLDPKDKTKGLVNEDQLANRLRGVTTLSVKKGVDIILITVESPSPVEAELFANAYAESYVDYNLEVTREDITNVLKYLSSEKDRKLNDLKNAENALEQFQSRTGLIHLEQQGTRLLQSITELDKSKGYAEVEITGSRSKYNELSAELNRIDPQLTIYLESQLSQRDVTQLQTQLSDLELKKIVELSNTDNEVVRAKIEEDYEKRMLPLRNALKHRVSQLEEALYVQTPDARRNIAQQLLLAGVELNQNLAQVNTISGLLSKFEQQLNLLPSQALEYAKIERERLSSEKLYMLLEEKYQEALISQNSRINNVTVIEPAWIPGRPTKPNRPMILFGGVILGLGLGIGYAFLRHSLDRTIKLPEELEKMGVSLLSWIPTIEDMSDFRGSKYEFLVANKPNSSIAESFKVLRTRVGYAKIESGHEQLKSILVTSSIPSEGKTTVVLNLAGSFALDNRKTLLLDCDLRKPRLHTIMETERFPGLSDYLFGNVNFEDIKRKTPLENLTLITSGTIPPNPSELLGSIQMAKFIEKLKNEYDVILIDSPPAISVADAEILLKITDGTILVVQAQKTPIDAFERVYNRFNNIAHNNMLGVVLNNFSFKKSYGYYYYNYYYYYSTPDKKKRRSEYKSPEIKEHNS